MTPEELKGLVREKKLAAGEKVGETKPRKDDLRFDLYTYELKKYFRQAAQAGLIQKPPWKREDRRPTEEEAKRFAEASREQTTIRRELVLRKELDIAYKEGAGWWSRRPWYQKLALGPMGQVLAGKQRERFFTFMGQGMLSYMTLGEHWMENKGLYLAPASGRDRLGETVGMLTGMFLFNKLYIAKIGMAPHPFGVAARGAEMLTRTATKFKTSRQILGLLMRSKEGAKVLQIGDRVALFMLHGGGRELVGQLKNMATPGKKFDINKLNQTVQRSALTGLVWGAAGAAFEGYYPNIASGFTVGSVYGYMESGDAIEALSQGLLFAALSAQTGPKRHRAVQKAQVFGLTYKYLDNYFRQKYPKESPKTIAQLVSTMYDKHFKNIPMLPTLKEVRNFHAQIVRDIKSQKPVKTYRGKVFGKKFADLAQMKIVAGADVNSAIEEVNKHMRGGKLRFTDKHTDLSVVVPEKRIKTSPLQVTVDPIVKAKARARSRLNDAQFETQWRGIEDSMGRAIGTPNFMKILKAWGVKPNQLKFEIVGVSKRIMKAPGEPGIPLEVPVPTAISIDSPAYTERKVGKPTLPFKIFLRLGRTIKGLEPVPTKAAATGLPAGLVGRDRTVQMTGVHELIHNLVKMLPETEITKWNNMVKKSPRLKAVTLQILQREGWAKEIPKHMQPEEIMCDFGGLLSIASSRHLKAMRKAFPKPYAWMIKNIWKGQKPEPPTVKPEFVKTMPEHIQYLEVAGAKKVEPKWLKAPGITVVAEHYTTEEGLKVLKPALMGKGKLPEKQKVGRLKKVFFYELGAKKVEPMFKGAKGKYIAKLEDIYPPADPLGLWKKAKGNIGAFERLIKKAGYMGYMSSDRPVIVSFYNVKVKPPAGFERLQFSSPAEVKKFLTQVEVGGERYKRLPEENAGTLILTPFQGDVTSAKNLTAYKGLHKWLRDNGYSFLPITGHTKAWGNEAGFLVATNPKTLGKLADRAFTKYKQEWVIFRSRAGQTWAINRDGRAEMTFDRPKIDKEAGIDYSTIHTPTGDIKFSYNLFQASPRSLTETWPTMAKTFGLEFVIKRLHRTPYKPTRMNQPSITSEGAALSDDMTLKSGIPYETAPRDVIRKFDRALTEWFGETNVAYFRGIKSGEFFENTVNPVVRKALRGLRKIRQYKGDALKERMKRIDRGAEEPEFFKKLNPEEQKTCLEIHKHLDKLWSIASQSGILEAYVENYIPHLYKDKPERVQQWIRGLVKGKLGTRPRFTLQRKFLTSTEAEKAGLHPIRDPAMKIQVYEQALYRAMANKRLVVFLKNLTTERGLPVLMNRKIAPSDYRSLDIPALATYLGYKAKGKTVLFKQPVMCDPKIAKSLKNVFDPYTPRGPWMQAYLRIRGGIKRVIMYNPLIHGTNIFSDVLDEATFNPYRTAKIMKRGGELWKHYNAKTEWAIKHGLNLSGVSATAHELYEKLTPKLTRRKIPLLSKLGNWSDKILWEKIVRNSQLGLFEMKVSQLVKKGMGREEAGFAAGHYVNDLLGTLPHIWMTRMEREVFSTLFFARNWTLSNLRLVTGMLGVKSQYKFNVKGKEIGLPNFLTHKGLPGELQAIQNHYVTHIGKGVFGLIVYSNLMQMGFQAMQGKKITTTFQNEHGHMLDIDTGMVDRKNRKIYMKPHLFRYISDIIGWTPILGDPLQTFQNKIEPLLKSAVEIAFDINIWRKRPLVHRGAGFWEKRLERFEHLLEGLTPIEVLTGRPGTVRNWFEKLLPFTGTWVRHGIAPNLRLRWKSMPKRERLEFIAQLDEGGRMDLIRGIAGKLDHTKSADIALEIIKFQTKKRYQKIKLDEQVDALIQHGEIKEAVRLMVLSKRYHSAKGILERLEKFNWEEID